MASSAVALKKKTVVWFNDVSKEDISIAGGKGANLGEMTRAGIPVPPGFIVTSQAYFDFLTKTRLSNKIKKLLLGTQVHESSSLNKASAKIKELIIQAQMPEDTAEAIRRCYAELGEGYVAVRSSATAEDLPDASFAGQQSTFLNVNGTENVVKAVQACWASLFEARAIFYREDQKFDHMTVGIAVPVQRMVQSEKSGVMFTIDPNNGDTNRVIIEAAYGLGEAVVSGAITPDLYVVDKEKRTILERRVNKQDWLLTRNTSSNGHSKGNMQMAIPVAKQVEQKLSDTEVLELTEIGVRLEGHYNAPQDVEWAREGNNFYLVQSRPVTAISTQVGLESDEISKLASRVLLTGTGAGPGIASGPVKIVMDPAELDRVLEGDILVTGMTTPDFVPAMKRAAAIITDLGGRTCHAAIVSREMGIPCVVGTEAASRRATERLKDGQIVTVAGSTGAIYEGVISIKVRDIKLKSSKPIKTKTRVYVNLSIPEAAEEAAKQNVDGVGLLRAEFIITDYIKEHPRYMLEQGRGEEFITKLARGLESFASVFNPRPVVYRATDFKTNEYRGLVGGAKYESHEENPMIGYRGASRYIADREVFKLEIEAIKRVRQKYKNLWIMIPFVRTPEELAKVKAILEENGLRRSADLKLWMMVEIPSNIILLDEFIDVGLDGISIGSNDLTQLTLGVDRDNGRFNGMFDERNEAVTRSLEKAVKTATKRGITVSICGQAPSDFPEITQKLVRWGTTSVSVNRDVVDQTRQIVADVEKRLGTLPSQG